MNSTTKNIIQQLIERLQSGDHPNSVVHGEVDFPLLSALSNSTDGWLGLVCQELLEALQYSEDEMQASVHLEKTASILIAWSAALRQSLQATSEESSEDKLEIYFRGNKGRCESSLVKIYGNQIHQNYNFKPAIIIS